jgi:hypothetical protein
VGSVPPSSMHSTSSSVMPASLPEHCQQHDNPIRFTPVGYPRRDISKPDPQLPDRPFQMIRPRTAELAALLGQQAAHLVDAFEVAVAETVQPATDFGSSSKSCSLRCVAFTDSEATSPIAGMQANPRSPGTFGRRSATGRGRASGEAWVRGGHAQARPAWLLLAAATARNGP